MSENTEFYCPRCQIGRCLPGTTTYVSFVNGQLFSAPDTPVAICDVCGYHEFQSESIRLLNRLIDNAEVDARTGQSRTAQPRVENNGLNKKPHPKP